MNKTIQLLAFIAIIFCASFSSQAQSRVGVGLGYGSEVSAGAIALNGEFYFNSNFALSPGVIIYFEDVWEANGNLNFGLSGTRDAAPYLIGGLNLTSAAGNSEIGLNAGIGANFDLGWRPKLSTEVKYVIGDFDQLVLSAVLKFPF